jgi:hypothetical protein
MVPVMDAILHRRSYSVPTDLSSMKSTVVTQKRDALACMAGERSPERPGLEITRKWTRSPRDHLDIFLQ